MLKKTITLALLGLSSIVCADLGIQGDTYADERLFLKKDNTIYWHMCYYSGSRVIVLERGISAAQAKKKCGGYEKRFPPEHWYLPVEAFKKSLRRLITLDRKYSLWPLSAREVEAYLNPDHDQDRHLRASHKVESEISKLIEIMEDPNDIEVHSHYSNRNEFIYTLLHAFEPRLNYPCGLQGSVSERINDCSLEASAHRFEYSLVSHSNNNNKEIYIDTTSGILWSNTLANEMTLEEAISTCLNNSLMEKETGLRGLEWRLPTMEEYQKVSYGRNLWMILPIPTNIYMPPYLALADDPQTADFVEFAKIDTSYGHARVTLPSPYSRERGWNVGSVRCVSNTKNEK